MTEDIQKISHKKVSLFGIVIILLVFGLFGVWAIFSQIDLAVQAPGEVIVKSYKKTVMHPQGGIVDKIYIKEGDYVKKGEKLLSLDSTQLRTKLKEAQKQFENMLAQKARIEAELKNSDHIDFPSSINEEIKQEQQSIFNNRRKNLHNQLQTLKSQINELKNEITSIEATIKYKSKILNSYQNELTKWQDLYEKGLVDQLKILDLQRKIDQLQGEIQSLKSQIEQNRSRITELKNRIKLTKSQYKKELYDTLAKINEKLPTIESQIAVLKDAITKNIITAPSQGNIVSMKIHAPGEVVTPHKPILYIVPRKDQLIVEAHISPMDIDKVKPGEQAEIHFASYVDPSAKPVYGKVIYVSADIIKDERDPRIQYYKALVQITPEGLKAIKENGFKIVPGMPVTVFIKAGKRSFISYILMPLEQLLKGAFHAN